MQAQKKGNPFSPRRMFIINITVILRSYFDYKLGSAIHSKHNNKQQHNKSYICLNCFIMCFVALFLSSMQTHEMPLGFLDTSQS